MNEANRLKLGGFLLISIALLVIGFISVGVGKLFEPRYRAMTVLNTSVEGLAVGSPVKYLGLPVGQNHRHDHAPEGRLHRGLLRHFPVGGRTGRRSRRRPCAGRHELRDRHAQEEYELLHQRGRHHGGAYLELSISDSLPPAMPHLDVQPGDGVIYIPSRPSHIGNAIQNISRMLDELEKVNFIQLADKLNETLDNMSEILNRGELKSTLNNINQICSNLEISSRRLQAALSEENVQKVNRAIDNLDAGILSLRKFGDSPELGTMVRSLNTFLTDASAAIKKAEAGGAKLSDDAALKLRLEMTLTRLDNSLRQLQEFTQNVENDPNQFVKGRPGEARPSLI